MDKIRLKGILIDRGILNKRYNIELTDIEWNIFCTHINNSWNSKEFELDRVINKHVFNSLSQIGFKAKLEGAEVILRKD